MSAYKKYMHVERLGTDETQGLLNNSLVVVTAKVDGTNGVVFWDDANNCVGVGSRNRVLTAEDDNAGFYAFIQGDTPEACALRMFVTEHPHLIIYGEWMGSEKFIGSFKRYDRKFLNTFILFDVYDTTREMFLDDLYWRVFLSKHGLGDYQVEVLEVLDHPTMEDIERVAAKNHFLMPNEELVGEGVVCRVPGWKNKYGRETYGKLIYKEFKSQGKKPHAKSNEDVEHEIVLNFLTNSELDKSIAKVCVIFEADTFDMTDKRMRATYLSLVWKDLLDECPNWSKKFKNPVVDFRKLNHEARTQANEYLKIRFERAE